MRRWFAHHIYPCHGDKIPLRNLLLDRDGLALNIGCGLTNYGRGVINYDMEQPAHVNGDAHVLPFRDGSFGLVILSEIVEHVSSPMIVLSECKRVLCYGGICYVSVPFIMGYHPCPNDYWRFTSDGLRALVTSSGFSYVDSGCTGGSALGFYRMCVDFAASALYVKNKVIKCILALLFLPIQLFEIVYAGEGRIAAGYYCIARKA